MSLAPHVADACRVAVVDEHPVFRLGLCSVISRDDRFRLVGVGREGHEIFRLAEQRVDVITLDLDLAGRSGLQLVENVHQRFPSAHLLVVSAFEERFLAEMAVRAGARGYVPKRANPEQILDAIQLVHRGDVYLSPEVMARLARRTAAGSRDVHPFDQLTDREIEVLHLMARGWRPTRIAEALHISPKTVETHQSKARRKLGVSTGRELLRVAVKWFDA